MLLFFTLRALSFSICKGETRVYKVSPLFVILPQQSDTLKKSYLEIKNNIKSNELNKSLELALKLLEDSKKNNNNSLEYLSNYLIADIFLSLNNHNKSIIYFKESLKLLLRNKNYLIEDEIKNYDVNFTKNGSLIKNYFKLGTVYLLKNRIDSAKYFLNKTIEIKTLRSSFDDFKALAYNNLSGIYIRDSLYGKARELAYKALELKRKTNNKLTEASTLGNIASIHVLEKNYKEAKELYRTALDLIDKDKSATAFKYKRDLYLNLAWALYNLKDYNAYNYQKKSYIIKDSLRDVEVEQLLKGVYEKYQVDIRKEQVNLANKQLELKKAEEQTRVWFFGVLSLLVIISSGVILYNYKLRQKNLRLKLEQTELAQKSKLEKLKSESQVRILNATLDGKETERKQIAETLHDSVSTLLSSANLHLQATKMQFNGDAPVEINKTQKIIVEASQTIRDLSHTLVSSVLLKFGLKYAIKDMAEKYSNSQIEIVTDIKNVRRYQQSFEIKANNIIQELVNNILKHSKATKATVNIVDENGILFVNIQDNGKGFNKKEILKKDGLGINQIEARIQMMKGKFHIDSNAKNGTKVKIELPILEKKEVSHA